jgi:transcriptional regulator with XRE-family HTH domain
VRFQALVLGLSQNNAERFAGALAAVFAEARVKAGLSQKKLAAKTGVGRTGIVTFEAGGRNISMLLCKMLSDGIGRPLSELIEEAETRSKTKDK